MGETEGHSIYDLQYEIRVKGRLDGRLAEMFDGLTLQALPEGETLLRARLPDSSALYGLLSRLRDLGLTLILVQRIEPS